MPYSKQSWSNSSSAAPKDPEKDAANQLGGALKCNPHSAFTASSLTVCPTQRLKESISVDADDRHDFCSSAYFGTSTNCSI
jgi:hypothetical protein